MSSEHSTYIIALGMLAIGPPLLAYVLKMSRAPGWAVLGGLLAGVLLGPTIFGRVMPQRFESIFLGGGLQRAALEDLHERHQRDLTVVEHVDGGEAKIRELKSQYEAKRAEILQSLDAARWEHQVPLRSVMIGIVVLTLLGGAAHKIRHRDHRQGRITPLSIGVWAALLPAGLAIVAARAWWGMELDESLVLGAALAIGPWALGSIDKEVADGAEYGGAHMIQTAGRIASMLALTLLGIAIWMSDPHKLIWVAPLLFLPLSWIWPATNVRLVKSAVQHWVLPLLAALVMLKVDLIIHARLGMIVVIMLLAGDGRWIGSFCGAMLTGGRRSLRTMRLILGMMSCAPTMLAVAALASYAQCLSEPATLALALGAGLIEASTPARRMMARRLVEAEDELEELNDPS